MPLAVARKIWLPAATLVVLLGAYAAAGYLLAPRWIESAARGYVEGRLGLRLQIGAIEVAPFALSARIDDLAISSADGAPIVGWRELGLKLSADSLWRRGLVIDRVQIGGPRVAALLDADRRLNLLALLPPTNSDDNSTPPAGPQALPAIELREFVVTAGKATFEDRSRSPSLQLDFQPIAFTLRDFSTHREATNRYRLQARAASGEALEWQGSLDLQPFAARGEFKLSGLTAATLRQHAADLLPFVLADGQMRLRARYEVAVGQSGGLMARARIDAFDAANLAIAERTAAATAVTPALRIAGLAIRDATVELAPRRIDLGRVALQGMSAEVIRDASGLNLQRLISRDSDDEAPTQWTIALPRVAVVDSAARFEDRTRAPAVVLPLEQLTVTANGFDSAIASEVALRIAGRLAGGTLKVESTVSLPAPSGAGASDPGDPSRGDRLPGVRGQVVLEGFDLLTLAPYLDDRVRLDVRSGRLDVAGDIDMALANRLRFEGRLALRDLRALDRAARRDLVRWQRLGLEGVGLQVDSTGRGTLRIAVIDAQSPYVDLVIGPDGQTNIGDALSSDSAEAASARPPLAVVIDRVRIRDGSANFADLSVTPNFGTGIQTLSGTITGLSSAPESRATVALAGGVDRYAPVSIAGEVNYLSARSYTDLKVVFRNMELTTLNPYSGKFAGYRIERGKLSADFAYRIADRKLEAEHKILLTQLQLGERVESKDAIGLPLKLAIALLKDRNGNIELDLPVSGSLDDPQFRVGPIVWKMFINLVGKIVTAPFALLGSLFGGGDETRFVEFAPGSATLTPTMQERLVGVRKALIDRPDLRLELPLATDATRDGDALREVAWQRDLAQFAPQALRADRGRYLKQLLARYTAADADPAALLEPLEAPDRDALRELSIATLETALRTQVAITDADFESLARARAAAVQDVLLKSGEIDPVRVFITRPVPASTTGDVVRLELALSVD